MKKMIKRLEKKVGVHDTNLIFHGIGLVGLTLSVFISHYVSWWILPYMISLQVIGWAFERGNKKNSRINQ